MSSEPRATRSDPPGESGHPGPPEGGHTDGDSAVRSYLIFQSGNGWFAVDARVVDEVVEDGSATPLPMAPTHVPGLVIIRGRAIPLFALENFLGLDADEAPGAARSPEGDEVFRRVVVVRSGGIEVGVRTVKVRGVVEVPLSRLSPPDALLAGRLGEFCEAQIDDPGGLTAVLALDRLLEAARVRA